MKKILCSNIKCINNFGSYCSLKQISINKDSSCSCFISTEDFKKRFGKKEEKYD